TLFCEGRTVGYIGSLHPEVLKESKIKAQAVVAEIELIPFQRTVGKAVRVKTPSKYPSVERDIAFIADEKVSAASIQQVIKKVAGAYLQSLTVTDEFRGGDLPKGSKSISFRMILQDE